MTSIGDTRLIVTFKFPPSKEVQLKIAKLVQYELRQNLLLPSIVLTEYVKLVGSKIGAEVALTQIHDLEDRGASIIDIDGQIAVEAGKLLIKHSNTPIADALIAAAMIVHEAEYVVSDDPHFKKLGVKTKWI